MRKLLLVGVVFLAGCASDLGFSGFNTGEYWSPREGDGRVVQVRIIGQREINTLAVQTYGQRLAGGVNTVGLADWWSRDGVCQIWITRDGYNTGALQHELRHCFEGAFHY